MEKGSFWCRCKWKQTLVLLQTKLSFVLYFLQVEICHIKINQSDDWPNVLFCWNCLFTTCWYLFGQTCRPIISQLQHHVPLIKICLLHYLIKIWAIQEVIGEIMCKKEISITASTITWYGLVQNLLYYQGSSLQAGDFLKSFTAGFPI